MQSNSEVEVKVQELSKTLNELQALNRLAMAISSTMDLDAIINNILKEAINLTKASQGSILLTKDELADKFTTLIRVGTKKEKELVHKICMNIAGWILSNQEPLLLNNILDDARFKGLALLGYPIQSVLGIPIQVRGKIVGIIILHNNKGEKKFAENDLRLLNIIASQSAQVLENASVHHKIKEENLYLKKEIARKYQFEEIIGRAPAMEQIFKLMEKVIPTDVRVLIEGESGTGKELIARAIHYNGPRKNKRFLAIDCGALPENLLESELFGHVKGAFTGATESKKGLFQAADGGTLFLDEIDNTSPALQTKLLRAIQEGEIRPVGGTNAIKVDVRILCATSQDLSQSVRNGTFREELLFRLKVVTLKLPPLRERKEDIPILASHFLKKFSQAHKKSLQTFSKEASHLLGLYKWRGNVRELEHAIERCVVLAEPERKSVDVDLLPDEIVAATSRIELPIDVNNINLASAVEHLERKLVVEALRKFKGNRTKAAESLGLSRRGLLNKIERYGLET
ncbi:MAG: sigma 54-interacting transcriptional regulator [bacterium]